MVIYDEKQNAREVIKTEKVLISTVDAFLKDKKTPNLIRMDVEGYEYNIIKGMNETLKKMFKSF